MASALDSLGTFKQGDNIRIVQVCSDASYVNISSISLPNSINATGTIAMTNLNNGEFYYDFNQTQLLGRYDVRGVSDGCDKTFATYFDVTPTGFVNTLGFYILLIGVMVLIIILGFSLKESWFVMIGGMGLMLLGLYSINSGIAGFRDMFMTWTIGLFEIGIGFILSMMSAQDKMDL
jgi:hypothetical protein